MIGVSRRRRGLGLITALVVLGVTIALAATLTAHLAMLDGRSARFAQSVRARALADAGVEAALARLAADPSGPASFEVALAGGRAAVSLNDDARTPNVVRVRSQGVLTLAGGELTCDVAVTLSRPASPAPPRVLGREEHAAYRRRDGRAHTP